MDSDKLEREKLSDEEIKEQLRERLMDSEGTIDVSDCLDDEKLTEEVLQAMVDTTKYKDAQRNIRINEKKRKARADRKKAKKRKKK